MVNYENLTIYKSSLDFAVYFEKIVKYFDKYHRFSIGQDLRTQSRKIVLQIIRINTTKKIEDKQELLSLLEEMKLLIHLSKQAKAFMNFNSYSYSSTLLADICRQAENWHNKSKTHILCK
jgi:hypothetical protein